MLGKLDNYVGGDPENAVKYGSLLGTVYKGGIVVPVIITLLFTVIALSIERFFALRTAFGKSSLTKFVINVKQAINAGDMAKAQQICDKQQGCVANVVGTATPELRAGGGWGGYGRRRLFRCLQGDGDSS